MPGPRSESTAPRPAAQGQSRAMVVGSAPRAQAPTPAAVVEEEAVATLNSLMEFLTILEL